jgi:hypothetical protein
MSKVVETIFKDAASRERKLYKLFKKEKEKAYLQNEKDGLSEYLFFAYCNEYETDDMFGKPQKIEEDGVCVWKSNAWVSSNKMPCDVEVMNGRFPVKCVSLWYTPYHYMTNIGVDELYKKSETEKILYQDFDVKISMVRRNVIPNFRSVQYCHKIAPHEYVMYLKRKKDNKKVEDKISQLYDEMKKYPPLSPERRKLADKRHKLYESLYYWHECFHADKLSSLKAKANHYFNDWYK